MPTQREPLFLAFVLEVTSDVTFKNVCWDALVVPDELVDQSGTGKVGLRLRKDRLPRPSVDGDEQRTVGESNLNRAVDASKVKPFVDAGIFRQNFGRHFYRGFLSVAGLADPVLLPVVRTFIADGFHHFRVGDQPCAELDSPWL